MGSAGAVRRLTDSLQLFFQLSDVPKAKWVLHARLYLEGLAADYVNIAMATMPVSDCSDWPKFCALLSIRFGQIDPDAEFWDQLRDLKQGVLSAAEYVHKMRYCFNGIIELPLSDGEKIERFMSGLNAPLKRLVIIAPLGMGRNGKWLDADELMSYAVLQARALPNAGAASHAVPAVGSMVPKTASAGGQKQKKKRKANGSGNGAAKAGTSGKFGNGHSGKKLKKASIRDAHMKEWFKENNRCYHCCKPGHASFNCKSKDNNEPAAAMPDAYKKASKE
ncbi:TPA: hypothetical protein ACH3X2_000680 [Trebouxia sp. C0005]